MKIIDRYILKKFYGSFIFIVLILSSIAIVIDISQKLARIQDAGSTPTDALLHYYPFWAIWLINTFLPVAVFITVIFFTSRMTMQTEIVGILSGGISFYRLTRPYVFGAMLLAFVALATNNFILPWANIKKNKYQYEYLLSNNDRKEYYQRQKISSSISKNEYVFVESYDRIDKQGNSFVYQKIDSVTLKEEWIASSFNWNAQDSTYILKNVYIRIVKPDLTDSLNYISSINKKLPATPDEILPEGYVAETMNTVELQNFITRQKAKGSKNVNLYQNELQQRNSLPFSTFILTILALSLSSQKKRGGIGMNLAIGIVLAFVYIFFNQVSMIYSEQGYLTPFIAAWLPNICFTLITAYLYRKRAKL